MPPTSNSGQAMGVIVVMYRSSDVIADCLTSLLKSRPWLGRIVLVDNASPDESVEIAVGVAVAHGCSVIEHAPHDKVANPCANSVEIVRSTRNRGFAGGVNLGLHLLEQDAETGFFWILNPDCELATDAARAVLCAAQAGEARGGFALLGTRVRYRDEVRSLQSDGGVCSRWTGRCRNLNQGCTPVDAPRIPDADCNFISGASMIASRRFLAQAGGMTEDYFLYYEEVDWAWRREALPLLRSLDAVVFHHGGTAIGSGSASRAPSPLSCYFNFRNRVRFIRRHNPQALMPCYVIALLEIIRFTVRCRWRQARAGLRGILGLAPPAEVALALSPADRAVAFGVAEEDPAASALRAGLQSPA